MALTWSQDMASLVADLIVEFGNLASFNGAEFQCVSTPVSFRYEMGSGYTRMITAQLDAFREKTSGYEQYGNITDCGLYQSWKDDVYGASKKRPVIVFNGQKYEVANIQDDNPSDPSVKLFVSSLQ